MAFCDTGFEANVALSFGSIGDAFDNAAMEGGGAPPDDAPGEHVAHERGERHARPRRDIGEIDNALLVGLAP